MKKRKDCFFGLHFDAHAVKEQENVGKDLRLDLLEELFKEVKPDFVQCDSKGHPGIATFKTEYGTYVKMYRDSMRDWRRISQKYGALLFAHHSGLFDRDSMRSHPEWAVLDKNGNTSTDFSSVFSQYVDKKLIPQLKELAGEYGLDGAWMDGECWAAFADYSDQTKEKFKEKTGLDADENPAEFLDFNRQGFRDYVKHYLEEVKKEYPEFEIASNWMFTSLMPEKPSVPVDFLSGDLAPTDSVHKVRKEVRLMENMGKPWDLMAWGFSYPVTNVKGVEQLQQEASMVISHGGSFQVNNRQDLRYGLWEDWIIPDLVQVADFCRARKDYVWHGKSINDVCIVYSTKAYYAVLGERLFGPDGPYNDDLSGVLDSVLDNGFASDVLLSADAAPEKLKSYGLVVLTNAEIVEEELKKNLLLYALDGGNLVITGVDSLELFKSDLNIKCVKHTEKYAVVQLYADGKRVEIRSPYSEIEGNGKVLAKMLRGDRQEKFLLWDGQPAIDFETYIPAAMRFNYGKGTITVVPFNLGTVYYSEKTYQLNRFFSEVLNVYDRKVKCDKKQIEINLTTKDGKEYIHLISLLGDHNSATIRTFDYIPPIYDITVDFKTDKKVSALTLLPEKKQIDFVRTDNGIRFNIPELKIYSIVGVEYTED